MSNSDGAIGARPPRSEDPRRRVLNEAWPLRDANGRHARGIPDQRHPIPVEVRLELVDDGEVWVAGTAARWTRTHVYVNAIGDPRAGVRAVWVLAGDVRRR